MLSKEINLFPNPVNDKITISVREEDISLNSTISIFTIHGQLLQQFAISRENTIIDVCEFKEGVYIIKETTDKGIVTKKFIKQ